MPQRVRTRAKPTFIDLFAGAGLFGHAFEQAGFRQVLAVENDKHAAETHRKNSRCQVIEDSVTTVNPPRSADVLIAGPPCQGFSTLGRMDPADPRNQLSLEVVRWAKQIRPSVVIIENVEAYLNSKIWIYVSQALRKLDYAVESWVLDASDFGVPQRRRRSFTLATDNVEVKRPLATKARVSVREAWDGLPGTPNGVNLHWAPKPSNLALARMRVIPEGGDKRDILRAAPHLAPPSWAKVHNEATDVWGRMLWDEPANTLRTCLQNPSKGRYLHPRQNRVISLREAARLHSISDDFQFSGKPTHVARQIGNGVPPSLGKAIADSVFAAV